MVSPTQGRTGLHGFGSVGFHWRHIAGSTERLMAYAQGKQLTPQQLAAAAGEHEPGASRDTLLAEIERVFSEAEAVIRQIDPATLTDPREVGAASVCQPQLSVC